MRLLRPGNGGPLTLPEPASYVSGRCRVTSPEKGAAGQKSAESSRKGATR